MSVVDKIRRRILTDSPNECWVWPGGRTWKGYGTVRDPALGRNVYVHRVLYQDAKGPIPAGMQIDHLCRNPSCCNPAHLEAVTPAENTRRGRSAEASALRRHSATHCRHGHAYTEENSYFDGRGARSCRICRERRNQEWAVKRRAKKEGCRTFTATGGNVVSIGVAKNG